ncbi:MAG: bifunctional fucokinase/L-fucose-1-P-guanylyltransferase [Lachnospiraceae bacterium]|nr:bifunctional fucokinase/L-fucose-1-P-guanylyltransferase [Lachnospiraceae bacterium]
MTYKTIKNLFLQQSYLDAWDDYARSLREENYIKWDYIILTASNEEQASTYREQIEYRLANHLLPEETKYVVLADPDGKRVGSGGATFNVLKYIAEQNPEEEDHFKNKRILVIHSGGDSKRVPQYSAIGKLFSPVPRELPNGYASTLFDEFIIAMSGVPSRIKEGMLVLSGDVLLLFNPLQIDLQYQGAAAISIKEHVSTGKNHGVFLNDGNGFVGKFLHKQSEEKLQELGAVNAQGNVDLDTGAVVFDAALLNALFSLIGNGNHVDSAKFDKYVNDEARISFYGDFLYPLAKDSTLEQYYKESAEGTINDKLLECRTELWKVLSPFSMRLLCLSPAEFIHFGTTVELLKLVTADIDDYKFLNWNRHVITTAGEEAPYAAHNAYVGKRAVVASDAYLEDCYVLENTVIGSRSIVSNVKLRNETVPENVVLHGLILQDGAHVVRIYGVLDNPKAKFEQNAPFLNTTLPVFVAVNGLSPEDLWDDQERYLWFARLYPVCDTMQEAVEFADIINKMAQGNASAQEIGRWKAAKRESLYSSFNLADTHETNRWERELEQRILSRKFINLLERDLYYKEALKVFGDRGITEEIYQTLLEDARGCDFSLKIRIYYAVSRFMLENKLKFGKDNYEITESLCFNTIQQVIYESAVENIRDGRNYKICKDQVKVALPVRVNWGGGWTDTPPHCNERGGIVLNAALKLKGINPIQVEVRRLKDYHIEFESTDIGVFGVAEKMEEVRDCHNPFDSFALHKAALIASGIIPMQGEESLQEILEKLGGGIYISTQVIGIPKGSGLGTSSILAGACIKAIFEFLGEPLTNDEIYDAVLGMEQIMSTGGGWQDQVGGLTGGIKFITTRPGIQQKIHTEQVVLSDEVMKELQNRFALIYTGQRRLARNLLRNVIGNYIGNRPESIKALHDMQPLSILMKFELERGNIDEFAQLLNQHWELSKQLDPSATNTCIDQIFMACEDLIDGKFICGAGGGGFLQVILKKGVTKQELRERLQSIFQNSGVDVWDSEFV